jgi:release factor glutamine methyltransferase
MRVGDALGFARALGIDRLDAQLLLAHRLQRSRAWLIAHEDTALDAAAVAAYVSAAKRRAAGEPLAYLTGEREFHGLALAVAPAVLIPRPETETLVDWALELLRHDLREVEHPRVIDLGTGSGAIAIAIKHRCPRAQVIATDLSAAALDIARANAQRHGLAIDWRQGDWWGALRPHDPRFDLALANPPYVAEADPHLAVLAHEPRQALTAGGDGLAALRRVIEGAPPRLRAPGWLLVEHGHSQPLEVSALMTDAGLCRIATRADLGRRPRVTGGRVAGSFAV